MTKNSLKKKVAIYIRVSTLEQAEHGFSIDEQKERLIAYCKAMNWDIAGIHVDGGFSGKDTNRPALQKMLEEIKKYNIVLIYKLDRLSRSQKDTLSIIEDVLIKSDVDIVSLQENLDTSTPFGRAAIGILSAFAQLERETFKERSILGRTGRARSGKWVGTSRPPIGYDYNVEKQQLVVNPLEAIQVKKVFDLYLQGTGLQKIARIMRDEGYTHKYGDWLYWGGVTLMIRNPVYTGKVKFNNQYFDGMHEAIIDQETFDKANEMLNSRQTGQLYKRKSPISKFLYCGACGARMFYRAKKNVIPKYYCYSRFGRPEHAVKDKNCKMRIWHAKLIDDAILVEIKQIATNKRELKKKINQKPLKTDNTKELKISLDKIKKQINKLLELYQLDNMPLDELNEKIQKMHKEKGLIESEISKNEKQKEENDLTIHSIQETAKQIYMNWDEYDVMKKIELLEIIIDHVTVYEDNIEIHWKFENMANE